MNFRKVKNEKLQDMYRDQWNTVRETKRALLKAVRDGEENRASEIRVRLKQENAYYDAICKEMKRRDDSEENGTEY